MTLDEYRSTAAALRDLHRLSSRDPQDVSLCRAVEYALELTCERYAESLVARRTTAPAVPT